MKYIHGAYFMRQLVISMLLMMTTYHANCMSNYLSKFERAISKIHKICNELDKESDNILKKSF